MPERRIHIQFSGSVRVNDSELVIRTLVGAIERRPENCGAFLAVRELGVDGNELDVMRESGGIVIPCKTIFAGAREDV